ncbi:MAG TPA: SDR family oxidoreductase [Verrucomicrobiae bacterium]|nr:SDR family oxidoreductase [Verrucomicrobiae bacterium]
MGNQKGCHLSIVINQMSENSIQCRFASAVRQARQVDILVNNAHEIPANDWRTVTGSQFTRHLTNASGYFLLTRLIHDRALKRRSSASIIMLGSMYGQVASYPEVYAGIGAATLLAYHVLKGGIIQLTRHLAVCWSRDQIRVNCLSPGPFPGPSVSRQLKERLKKKSPANRFGRPEELKGAVVFLVAEANSYVTGRNLIVDGGWSAW